MNAAMCHVQRPTAVAHCESAYLTRSIGDAGGPPPDLALVRGNTLEVFRVCVRRAAAPLGDQNGKHARQEGAGGADGADGDGDGARGGVDGVEEAVLERVCATELAGVPTDMKVLRRREGSDRRGRDALLLSFAEAKLCVAEYDPTHDALRVSSLHQFEGIKCGWLRAESRMRPLDALKGPALAEDPKGRCAAAFCYRSQLVLLRAVGDTFGDYGPGETKRLGKGMCAAVAASTAKPLADLGVRRLRAGAFLHGYNEPVLLLLHEREPTWAARYSLKHDTCVISAVSIDLSTGRHVPIWSVDALPSDAYAVSPVPAPLGGALVLTPNTLIYASQTATVALALNRASHWAPAGATAPPERAQFSMELDAAHTVWIDRESCLLFSKTGDIAVVATGRDGRGMPRMSVRRVGAGPLTAGACMLSGFGAKLVFMGSRLGDSLLVQCYDTAKAGGGDEAPASKRARRQELAGAAGSAGAAGDAGEDEGGDLGGGELLADDEEAELQQLLGGGASASREAANSKLSFLVRDSILNVAPLRKMGVCADASAPEGAGGRQVVVACAGHGKNGALAVLQRGVRPQTITEVGLPGVAAIWPVSGRFGDAAAAAADGEDTQHHSHLVMDMGTHTIVLATGEELEEVSDASPMLTDCGTLAAGDVLGGYAFCQAHAQGVRVSSSGGVVCEADAAAALPAAGEGELAIESACVCDPYVLVAGSRTASLGTIEQGEGGPDAALSFADVPVLSDATAFALHRVERTAWLSEWLTHATSGSSDGSHCTHLAAVSTQQGGLRMYAVPGWDLLFEAPLLADAPPLLLNKKGSTSNVIAGAGVDVDVEKLQQMEGVDDEAALAAAAAAAALDRPDHEVTEMTVVAYEARQPFLVCRLSDGSVVAYRAYAPKSAQGRAAALGFRRVVYEAVPLPPATVSTGGDAGAGKPSHSKRTLSPFVSMGSPAQRGIVVCGHVPLWLIEHRGGLKVQQHTPFIPGSGDGPAGAASKSVFAFAPFHNVNCPSGMVFAEEGSLVVASLPPRAYSLDMPARKAALRQTPVSVCTLHNGKLAAVACFAAVPPERRPAPPPPPIVYRIGERTEVDPDRPVLYDPSEEHTVVLVDLVTLQQRFRFSLEACEKATDIAYVTLKNTSSPDGTATASFVAVSTSYLAGEDVQSKGRVLLFKVDTIAAGQEDHEKGLFVGSPYLSCVCAKDVRGAAALVKEMNGYLVSTMANKVTVYEWTGSDLNQVSFFDLPTGAASVSVVKNFVLLTDTIKSSYFIRWREENKEMGLLSKDYAPMDGSTSEFLIDGSTLAMVAGDMWGDLTLQVRSLARARAAVAFSTLRSLPGRAVAANFGGLSRGGTVAGIHAPEHAELARAAPHPAWPLLPGRAPSGQLPYAAAQVGDGHYSARGANINARGLARAGRAGGRRHSQTLVAAAHRAV